MGDVLLALWKGEVWRHVTMEANFMDRQRQRVRANEASKTTTLHADHAFLNISFSCVRKLPNCTMDIIHRWTNFLFFFSSGTVLSDPTPDMTISPTFDKFNETYLTSMKFVTVRIQLTFSVCCHAEILLPWQRDVTASLYFPALYKSDECSSRVEGGYILFAVAPFSKFKSNPPFTPTQHV